MMRQITFFLFVVFCADSALAQGVQRRVETMSELSSVKPTAFATAGEVSYSVGKSATGVNFGGERIAKWERTSNLTTNYANVIACRDGGQWVFPDRYGPYQDGAWWGITGDGVTDETSRIQAAINSGTPRLILRGSPLFSHLDITNQIIIEGYGTRMLQVTNSVTNMLQISSSSVVLRGLVFDGRQKTHQAVDISDGVEKAIITSCIFTNLQESTNRITAIGISIHGETEVKVENCNFEDIYGLPDGIIGNPAPGTGFAHGIYINRKPGTSAREPRRILIKDSLFRRILPGEDSDAIRWTDSTWTYDDANVEVSNCKFENIGKRCIKASGSGGLFVNNTFTNNFNGAFQSSGWASVSGYMEQYSCISLYGRNHRVIGNKFNGGRIRHFIDTTVEASNCLIANNSFILSTNWGLNGLTSGTSGFGTIGLSVYQSQEMQIVNNTLEAVQYGIWFYNPVSDSTIIGNTIRSPGPDGSSTNGIGRGIKFGRPSTNYAGGALSGNMIVGNRIQNFRGGIEISESTNTFIAANSVTKSEGDLLLSKTAPDGSVWENMLSGGLTGSMKFYRPIWLHSENADSIVSTGERGQVIWDSNKKLPAFYDGAKWASPEIGTRAWTSSGLQSTNWYRVAILSDPGYGTRGSAKITIGSGGGYSSSSAEFLVGMNYSDAQIIMTRNWAYASGSGNPIGHVRVVRSIADEKAYFDFQPFSDLNAFVATQVIADWTTQAGLEPTNSWKAVGFTLANTINAGEAVSAVISNLNTKIVAFSGNSKEWNIGLDTLQIGESRFKVDAPSLNTETPLTLSISNTMQRVKRDTSSGVLYSGDLSVATANHTHNASNIVAGQFAGDRLGTGTPSTNLVLWGGGAGNPARWQTVPSTPSPTNGIADAPADGTFYGRRDNAWTAPAVADVSGLQAVLDEAVLYSVISTEGLTAEGLTSTAGLYAYDLPTVTPSSGFKPLVLNPTGFAISQMTTNNFLTQIGAAPLIHGHVIADTTGLQAALDSKPGLSTDNDMTGWNTFHGVTIDRRADTGRPTLWFYSADAPAIAKRWGISTASGLLDHGYTDFNFEVPSDSGSPTFFWMTAKRLQNDVASVDWTILDKKMRINGSWVVTDALTNGITYGRQNGAWVPVTPSTTFAFTNILADPGVVLRTNAGTLYIGSRSPVIFAAASDVTVPTSTTSETSVIGTLRSGESKTLAANSMTDGSVYKLEASGVFTSPSANWDGGIVRAKFGGLTFTFTINDADSWTPSDWEWNTTVFLTVKTAGSSASVSATGRLDYNYSVASVPLMPARSNASVSGTLNTTTSNTVDLTFQNNVGQAIDFSCRAVLLQRY